MIQTTIKSGRYYDSVTLLEIAQGLLKLTGVQDAAVVMGTPANKGILADADLLTAEAEVASADDLIISVRTESEDVALAAMQEAEALLSASHAPQGENPLLPPPKTLHAATERLEGANVALISVAGRYAASVARNALQEGLHVFLFSDNVTVKHEIALKKLGRKKGLLVMGPDAGTAILNGVALGFANAAISGPVGIVAASGTGLQAVTSQLTRMGVGITQAIGTGGRDLSAKVGGIMMLEGLKALQADPATEILVLVSKPPAKDIAAKVLDQLRKGDKPAVVCFLGGKGKPVRKAGGIPAKTLEEAALLAAALARRQSISDARDQIRSARKDLAERAQAFKKRLKGKPHYFRGLFSGGTFCYESQLILNKMFSKGNKVVSNAPVKKKRQMADPNVSDGHTAVDLGEDEFTVGRLHPMLDPTLRNRRILREAQDPETAIIFLDIVLGYGVHPDPAGAAIEAIEEAQKLRKAMGRELLFIASVCGTDNDPQDARAQEAKLQRAGMIVLPTNAAATRLAGYILT